MAAPISILLHIDKLQKKLTTKKDLIQLCTWNKQLLNACPGKVQVYFCFDEVERRHAQVLADQTSEKKEYTAR